MLEILPFKNDCFLIRKELIQKEKKGSLSSWQNIGSLFVSMYMQTMFLSKAFN